MKQSFETIRLVFSDVLYTVISILVALSVFLFNILITNLGLLWHTVRTSGIVELLKVISAMVVYTFSLPWYSVTILVLVSVLTGIVFGLVTFKVRAKMASSVGSKLGFMGMVLGVIAPSCSSCGIGVLAIIGAGSAFSGLPLHGTEIGILGVLLLVVSSIVLVKSIEKCESCQVVLSSKK